MNILVKGNEAECKEFSSKFNSGHMLQFDQSNVTDWDFSKMEVVFDFFTYSSPASLDQYKNCKDLIVFCNSVKSSLDNYLKYLGQPIDFKLIGFNGMPTFFNRQTLELTILNEQDREIADKVCTVMGTEYIIVEDRVGMVTPRVVCMIINEAYYTMEEGTADRESIDLAMKLGTNYPYGPFEWAGKIGLRNICELLEAVYEDSRDSRYEICPTLKKECR